MKCQIPKTKNFYFLIVIFNFALLFFNLSGAQALTVSPAIVEKAVLPGSELPLSVKIFNETDQPTVFYAQTENFRAAGGGASPEFLGNTDPLSAAAWFVVAKPRVVLAPGQSQDIPFKIVAPQTAEPGGHYAALFWSDAPPGQSGIGTTSRVGTLFLLKVAGEARERGLIKDFGLDRSVPKNQPVNFKLVFANLGNAHLRPTGKIEIYDYFNRLVYQTAVNDAGQAVLPGSERAFHVELADHKIYLGPFRAVATVAYGQGKNILTADHQFWLGLNYLIGLGLALAILIALLIFKKFRQRA